MCLILLSIAFINSALQTVHIQQLKLITMIYWDFLRGSSSHCCLYLSSPHTDGAQGEKYVVLLYTVTHFKSNLIKCHESHVYYIRHRCAHLWCLNVSIYIFKKLILCCTLPCVCSRRHGDQRKLLKVGDCNHRGGNGEEIVFMLPT